MVVSMSDKEFSRLSILLDVQARRLRVDDAMQLLGLKRRQIFRLVRGLRTSGAASLASKRRGRLSNNKLPSGVRDLTMSLVRRITPTSARRWRPKSCGIIMHVWCRARLCANG